jgi:hypothetical protein
MSGTIICGHDWMTLLSNALQQRNWVRRFVLRTPLFENIAVRPSDPLVQASIVLAFVAALCILMSFVLTVPDDCSVSSSGAVCLRQFPTYPPSVPARA